MKRFEWFKNIKQTIKKEWNKEPTKENKTIQYLAKQYLILFFLAMFGLTFLSRAADSIMVAKVNVAKSQNQRLTFQIEKQGTIKEQNTSITKLMQGVMVDQVMVSEGETIQEGDPVLAYHKDDLQDLYDTKLAALEKSKIEQKKLEGSDDSEKKRAKLDQKYAEQGVAEANENLDAARESINDEIENSYNSAKEEYDSAVDSRDNEVESAKEELEKAKAFLKELEEKANTTPVTNDTEQPKSQEVVSQEQLDAAKKAVEDASKNLEEVKDKWKSTLESAKKKKKQAKETYDSIVDGSYDYTNQLSSQNSAVTQAQKSLEEAGLAMESAEKKSSIEDKSTALTAKSFQYDIDLAQKEVNELKELLDQDAIVKAKESGVVVSLGIKAGEVTSGSQGIKLAVNGAILEVGLEKEDTKKIAVGDDVEVSIGDSKEKLKGQIKAIDKEEKDGVYACEVSLPENDYAIGGPATFKWSKDSTQYDMCIPINALREDGYRQTYVLVLREKESILGNEWQATRLDVTVLDKDNKTAAVEGGISYEDQIIVGGNKEIAANDRVRVENYE